MATITRFEDAEARQTAKQLVHMIYDLTDSGAFAQDYGLKKTESVVPPYRCGCDWESGGQ